ncbi:hypothetical protein BFJ69_g13598 [Fusarium oxysporum]|uniref:Myb-like domain-containing protein n=1 Tax=Fusarium oxysporum TaxID=5507 RepID=A0A420MK85_FUSOX|nr:hypothetical protein BFJ69_g13598 [Fusarium oxysporum]
MASANFDSEQRKLCQSLTPPASQPDTTSLHDKKALSALGKSRDTAICIPSDVDSDTEDENDESQELDSSQSYATRASFPDYLDLTTAKFCATESEAAIGVVTASTGSPAQAEAAPAWPNETQVSQLADAEPSQQSSCQIDHILTGDMSFACQAVDFTTPPTSPESQPYPVAADGQQLRPVPVSGQGNMMVDAVLDHGDCHDTQGHPDPPSTCTQSPRTTSLVEVVQAPPQESEVRAGNSWDDAIPEIRTPSPARPSLEPHQGQGLDDASCAPSDAESEVTEAGSGSPSESQVSSPSPSSGRFRHKSLQKHKTMQSKGGDADSEEGSGSEDDLNGLESQLREESSPSLPDSEDSGSEDDDFDDVHQGRKRRKVSKSPSYSVRNAAISARDSRRRRRSTRAVAHSLRERDTSALGVLSPTPSQARSVPPEASAFLARFQEWPLENVSMKRITENGKTTFQFQFEWPLCANHPHATSVSPHSTRSVATKKTTKRAPARRAKYSDDEDNFLIQLKEEEQLGWAEIRRRFAQRFPERGGSSLQVHYCTKLKCRRRT